MGKGLPTPDQEGTAHDRPAPRPDPFGPWPARRRWLWLAVTGLLCALWGPGLVNNLRPPNRHHIIDFYQEWASARNRLTGLPVYQDQVETLALYLDYVWNARGPFVLRYNAHPPTSILLALPLARLDYPDAVLVWNLLSLAALAASIWIMVRQLSIVFSSWASLPIVAWLVSGSPLHQQVGQGQLNLVLLLLLTGLWAAQRSGRPWWAGVLLGTATAIKLFPGFFFLYFLFRRDRKVIAAGLATLAGLTALTAALLGVQTYADYVRVVLPHVGHFRDWWLNASLVGYWDKLFVARSGHVEPLVAAPQLALALTGLSCLAVLAVLFVRVRQAGPPAGHDLTFALAVVAMLLVSPITWDHYFVLLLLPAGLLWVNLAPREPRKLLFFALFGILWLNRPKWFWHLTMPGPGEIPPPGQLFGQKALAWQALTFLSYQTYALLGFFLLTAVVARRVSAGRTSRSVDAAQSAT